MMKASHDCHFIATLYCSRRVHLKEHLQNNMTSSVLTSAPASEKTATIGAKIAIPDDTELLRTASKVTRDLNAPKPVIYWTDLLASVAVGYGALFVTIAASNTALAFAAALVSLLALYRAGSFIHELTHISKHALPGFRLAWNILVGVPLLLPSFLYEGVHNLHHARTRYGTVEDPEYLPLALMKPWTVPAFVIVAGLAPVGLLFRFAVLAPLSVLIPPLRKVVAERYSGLIINPEFRRRPAEGALRLQWRAQEIACSIWAITLLTAVATGFVPLRSFLIFMGIISGSVVLNQIRTLVAHLWENDGEVMTVTAQYLDSVNVPPPSALPALWAPVGLRYHGLHHLLPGLPYHALGEAHRRIVAALPTEGTYARSNHRNLSGLVNRLVRSTLGQRPANG